MAPGAGVPLKRDARGTAPTLGKRTKKSQTGKGWALGKWWRRQLPNNLRNHLTYMGISRLNPL